MPRTPLLALLIACGDPATDPAVASGDTGTAPVVCGTDPLSVEIGETVAGDMVSLDGEEPTLVFGPQGGHHLPLAVQVDGLGPAPHNVLLTMDAYAADGALRLGGFLRELQDPRPAGDLDVATWLDLWLVVDSWPLDDVRVVSAVVEELPPCDRSARIELTLSPE